MPPPSRRTLRQHPGEEGGREGRARREKAEDTRMGRKNVEGKNTEEGMWERTRGKERRREGERGKEGVLREDLRRVRQRVL